MNFNTDTRDLIAITAGKINDVEVQTVNARELHAFLEVKSEFRNWVKNRIEDFGFVENQDFVTSVEIYRGGERKDYHLTLDMAKELAMVERNAKGKQARQYFIDCERRVKEVPRYQVPQTLPEALRLAAEAIERNAQLEAANEEMKPKAEFHDAVVVAINAQTVEEVAKVLGMGRNRLFDLLRKQGLLTKDNLPYQQYLERGLFEVVEKQFEDAYGRSRLSSQTLVTGKGLVYIQRNLMTMH